MSLDLGLLLVTDRTQGDVDRVKYLQRKLFSGTATAAERAEFAELMKGAYNYTDLNRVGLVCQYLADRLGSKAGIRVAVTGRTDWTMADVPTAADAAAYLADVAAIRGALAVDRATPATPEDLDGLTYQEANEIEAILLAVEGQIEQIILSWRYAGEIYAGEV